MLCGSLKLEVMEYLCTQKVHEKGRSAYLQRSLNSWFQIVVCSLGPAHSRRELCIPSQTRGRRSPKSEGSQRVPAFDEDGESTQSQYAKRKFDTGRDWSPSQPFHTFQSRQSSRSLIEQRHRTRDETRLCGPCDALLLTVSVLPAIGSVLANFTSISNAVKRVLPCEFQVIPSHILQFTGAETDPLWERSW